jgi:hypothetical protein
LKKGFFGQNLRLYPTEIVRGRGQILFNAGVSAYLWAVPAEFKRDREAVPAAAPVDNDVSARLDGLF